MTIKIVPVDLRIKRKNSPIYTTTVAGIGAVEVNMADIRAFRESAIGFSADLNEKVN